ncbi:MAG: HAD-IC family P-type ATPase [Candidatus Onthovivens sp.]|nr:HAD-IC family P-type ATPase [Candidatus Onthovivens sp.]
MKKKFQQKKENVRRVLTKYDKGLTNYQVNLRKSQGLSNNTQIKVNRTYLDIFLKNFVTFFNILLIAIGVILIAAGKRDSCVFLVILIANISIGLFQDIRAKRMVDKLSLTTKSKVKVVREGRIKFIDSEDIVLDDVLIIGNDEIIPCDGRVLTGTASLNESLLTGESLPVKKIVGDVVYSGTYVTNGDIRIRVEKVGSENYIQQLQAKSKVVKRQKSLIYKQLNYLFKIISIIVIVVGIFMLVEYGYIKDAFSSWNSFVENVAIMAGSLVSMIPSGMYLLASTSLTVGALALMKRKVLVRDLYSVETLARVDTLCIDKTGTITDGTMSVYEIEFLKKNKFNKDKFDIVMGSFLNATKDTNFTSQALVDYFGNKGVYKPKQVIPFDSSLKYSAATLEEVGTIVLGAYGFFNIIEDNEVKNKIDAYNKQGFRTLLVGFSEKTIINDKIPTKIIPIAVIVIQDHIRDNAKDTIKWFVENDVNIKVISGDNPVTVSKIAGVVGIPNANKYISLENKTFDEIRELVDEYNVFGRVTPEQKEFIVKALREKKHTTAMFGDGVNDILAMKASDVSISVTAGSRAARDIANLVLLNNEFGSLPDIVGQGRRVINNLQRTCSLFLTKTIFSISLNIFFLLFGLFSRNSMAGPILWPFSTNHFYVWELITIGTSSFFLALEPNNERLKGHFLMNIFKKALPSGIIMGCGIVFMFLYSFFTKDLNGNNFNDLIEVSVYYISIASMFVLIQTCYKFNKYRLLVLVYAAVMIALMFLMSIYSDFNLLKLQRVIHDLNFVTLLIVVLIVSLILIGINFVIFNRKTLFKKLYEKHRN